MNPCLECLLANWLAQSVLNPRGYREQGPCVVRLDMHGNREAQPHGPDGRAIGAGRPAAPARKSTGHAGTPASIQQPSGGQRHPLPDGRRLPVAQPAARVPTLRHGLRLLLALAEGWNARPAACGASSASARATGPSTLAFGCHSRQPVGQDHRKSGPRTGPPTIAYNANKRVKGRKRTNAWAGKSAG